MAKPQGVPRAKGQPLDQISAAETARRLLEASRSVTGAAALLKDAIPREVMLVLMVADVAGSSITLDDILSQIEVSPLVSGRWVKLLEQRNMIERSGRTIRLSAKGRDATTIFIGGMRTALRDTI